MLFGPKAAPAIPLMTAPCEFGRALKAVPTVSHAVSHEDRISDSGYKGYKIVSDSK